MEKQTSFQRESMDFLPEKNYHDDGSFFIHAQKEVVEY
jgi:hypothetical protein